MAPKECISKGTIQLLTHTYIISVGEGKWGVEKETIFYSVRWRHIHIYELGSVTEVKSMQKQKGG